MLQKNKHYESISNKYTPRNIDEFYIDYELKMLLNNFINNHDYLNIILKGHSGSGKTSILNKLIELYFSNSNNTKENVLFINNSKDQGIQYFRHEVKTFCQTPSSIIGKRKIIAIDDVDIINEQSQQVFRNLIDTYDKNVIFLFTCSNVQKIIESIQSRLVIVNITNVTQEKMRHICDEVIYNEKIDITQDAIDFLVSVSNRSIRVLFNYLEKFKLLNQQITYEIAIKLCTNINFKDFEKYLQYIKSNDIIQAINILLNLYDDGYSVMDILDSFFLFIKLENTIEEKIKYELISYLCKYIHIFHEIHEDEIELSLFTNNIISLFKT
tara:strand:+ start:419 stop:1396 length:978 start_codon:yes stop_codon:yes gene_type:complete